MKLPRLRVRELVFLAVYVALIGQSLILSRRPGRIGPLPSGYAGHVWIGASELQGLKLPTYQHVQPPSQTEISFRTIQGRQRELIKSAASPRAITVQSLINAGWDERVLRDQMYYLVPESWARENLGRRHEMRGRKAP